jgi:hypothetical protein
MTVQRMAGFTHRAAVFEPNMGQSPEQVHTMDGIEYPDVTRRFAEVGSAAAAAAE